MSGDKIKILGIDPGSSLGVCIYTLNSDFTIHDMELRTYILANHVPSDIKKPLTIDKLLALRKVATLLLEEVKPVAVGVEEAFFNRLFPKSGLLLSEFIGVIKSSIAEVDRTTKIMTYPPKYIKSKIGASGKADKDAMTACLMGHLEIKPYLLKYEGTYTEHSIDACAIAEILRKSILTNPMLLQQ